MASLKMAPASADSSSMSITECVVVIVRHLRERGGREGYTIDELEELLELVC